MEQSRERGRRIAEREAAVGRPAFCHPFVAAELLAHLADPDDPALPHCHRAVAVLAHHCGEDIGVRLLPPPELELARVYYETEDEQATRWLNGLGALCKAVSEIDDPANFSDDMRRDFATIASGVELTEAQFVQDVFDHVVKAGDPSATTWEKVQNDEVRNAVLAFLREDETLLLLAKAEVLRVQQQLNAPETVGGLNEKASDLAARFPVPLRFYREVVRRIVMSGSNLTTKNRANMIWDKEIAFYLGETPVTGIGPVRLVTDDGMIVDIAAEAGAGERVDRIDEYLGRIGLADEITILRDA